MTFILIFKNLFEIAVSDSLLGRFCFRRSPPKEIKNKFIFVTDPFFKEIQRKVLSLLSPSVILYCFISPLENTSGIISRRHYSFLTSRYPFLLKEAERASFSHPPLSVLGIFYRFILNNRNKSKITLSVILKGKC